MFERRLKIVLGVLLAVSGALALRAAQVQVFNADHWRQEAVESMKRWQFIETTRGSLLDNHGRPIALEQPCIDACVDFRVITDVPNDAWVRKKASDRLRTRLGDSFGSQSKEKRAELYRLELARVRADIEGMWVKLAQVSDKSLEEIHDIRRTVVQKVEMRRRFISYRHYELALRKHDQKGPEPGWRRWLLEDGSDKPQLDSFDMPVAEETEAHIILSAIPLAVQNDLGGAIDRYPGLVLRPGTHRYYPYADAACHLIGDMSRVTREDLESDPNVGVDQLRQYYPNDLIGRTGLEALCEPALRGNRGRIERIARGGADDNILSTQDPAPGRDVRTTLDIDLQQEVEQLFAQSQVQNPDRSVETLAMHGAAIVIDVKTSEVRLLASYPTFDLNKLDENYAVWAADALNQPLMNRATRSQFEPGSTVKPIVGLGAITQGLVSVDHGIECTGYLVIDGRPQKFGKCWVAKMYSTTLGGHVAHHPVPSGAPHPTGYLTFPDALERSCNVYFETLADMLRIDGLSYWMDKFGLGRPTGIGISESKGRLPNSYRGPAYLRRATAWFCGIGQTQVTATPLQMANVAATIARGGIWMRPRLIPEKEELAMVRPATGPSAPPIPDRVDLHLDPAAIKAAQEGMTRVVNSRAGTGPQLHRGDVTIAGKTGTAQAARFSIIKRDAGGRPLRDENGKFQREFIEPSSAEHPNPRAPWYRGQGPEGKDLTHAWFIGFAPAEHPQIAFAVMVEYGGSGGPTAGAIARGIVQACIEHGYLTVELNRLKKPAAD